ncbi:transporter [Sesbania bispinosa]|nr:transporter [Sesbania bispinosa]
MKPWFYLRVNEPGHFPSSSSPRRPPCLSLSVRRAPPFQLVAPFAARPTGRTPTVAIQSPWTTTARGRPSCS